MKGPFPENTEGRKPSFFARDEEGLTAARARYEPYCAAVARNLLADPRDQEECLSDTWLRAWNAIPPHEPRSYLFAFLARITRHLSLDRCRSRDREKRGGVRVDALTEELIQCLPGGERPEEALALFFLAGLILLRVADRIDQPAWQLEEL